MQRRWLGLCFLVAGACGDTELLGETECEADRGDGVACLQAALLKELDASAATSREFDVVGREKRPATWTVPLFVPPESVHRGQRELDVEPAPNGGVWVAQPENSTRALIHLDEAGEERRDYASPAPWSSDTFVGDLSVSPTLQPLVEAYQLGLAGSYAHRSLGYVLEPGRGLVAVEPAQDLASVRTFAGPGDTIRTVSAAPDGLRLSELGRDGALLGSHLVTRPSELVAAAPELGDLRPQVALAQDGSSLLGWLVRDATTGVKQQLLTLVDASGSARWHLRTEPRATFTAVATGGFAIAVPHQQGFRLFQIDEDANVLGSWLAQPSAYHGGMPAGLASDAEGNLYFAQVTGLRQTPEVTVCKLDADIQAVQHDCVTLQDKISGATRIDGIAVPRPNTVVVAYATSPTPANTGRFPYVSRIDF